MDRKQLIQQTLGTIWESIEHLKSEQERIVVEISEKSQLLDQWQRELNGLEKGKGKSSHERLPKGEPLRRINALYENDPRAQHDGLTIKEIEKRSGIGWTTVRNVVHGEKNGFADIGGSRWRRTSDIDKEKKRGPLKAVS
ncbi:MAG TPA: hypothetical protein VIW95_05080 [Candidatus Binatus sp.]|uniref:hypothetical protein n=1 Tax=Candidatus Binatus sp. TaxID=2811406 RepID=UPI002F3EDFCB